MTFDTRRGLVALIWVACIAIAGMQVSDTLALGHPHLLDGVRAGHLLARWALAGWPAASQAAYLALFGAAVGVFALCAGLCMGERLRSQASMAAMLTLQLAIGALAESDLLYLVAVLLGFALPLRVGLRWLPAVAGALALSFGPVAMALRAAHPACDPAGIAPPPVYLDLVSDYLQEIALQAFVFCIGYFVRAQHDNRVRLTRAYAELLAAQQHLAEAARQGEQQRIAQRLDLALGERLHALQDKLAGAQTDGVAARSLATAKSLASGLTAEIGAAAAARQHEPIALARALGTLCASIPSPRVELTFDPDARIDSPALAHTILRSVQEAVSNAVRHAGAQAVRVAVSRLRDGLMVSIHDDGRGSGALRQGSGLAGIGERVAAHGGRLDAGNRAEGGFALDIWLPLGGVQS